MVSNPQFVKKFFLAAGQCDAEGKLPLQWLVQRLIDVATLHANSIDIGYSRLNLHGASWVLHKVVTQMESYPRINEEFTVETWIVDCNRLTSDRAFCIRNCRGNVIGYALTTWVAIDVKKRRAVRLDAIFPDGLPACGNPVIENFARIKKPDVVSESRKYMFRYTDLDCNRHVTTRRYVELMMNILPLDFYDSCYVSRFELAFHEEALYGQEADIRVAAEPDGLSFVFQLSNGERALASSAIYCKKFL